MFLKIKNWQKWYYHIRSAILARSDMSQSVIDRMLFQRVALKELSGWTTMSLLFIMFPTYKNILYNFDESCEKFTITMSRSVTALMLFRRAAFKELSSCTQGPLATLKWCIANEDEIMPLNGRPRLYSGIGSWLYF